MINAYSPENNPSAQWRLMRLANGKVALQNVDSYRYLARCNNCYYYGSYPDSAFVHVEDPLDAPWAQWDMSEVHPGVVTFKSDSGLYLARCSNCVYGSYPDALFVHVSDADWNSAGQFKLYCK
ncbi:TPA: hypothetical protein N0F65_007530 [Lagenidium giganteum]|uniref:Uncharacterized protein n=1 Tax=Lagenidium giganteum TaxID=4803 RepID=A0AAV2ZD23_9STRA|nr:TPA: hypothetical protein N0F65_007530 [Lagenidium giganteum]